MQKERDRKRIGERLSMYWISRSDFIIVIGIMKLLMMFIVVYSYRDKRYILYLGITAEIIM